MEQQESEVSFGYGQEDGYDAVVVGSGYGGSVAACRLSMAGVRVCLVEKGRRWESKDFPTDSSKIFSAMRMENQNLGISFGPKDALFQVILSSSFSLGQYLPRFCILLFVLNHVNRRILYVLCFVMSLLLTIVYIPVFLLFTII